MKIRELVWMTCLLPVLACAQAEPVKDECAKRVDADARLAPLRDKLPYVVTDPNMQQLADHTKPTKAQHKALIAYDEDRSFCETYFSAQFSGPAEQGYAGYVMNSKKLRASLFANEIDFANYVSTDADNSRVFINYVKALAAQHKSDQDAAARAQAQQDANERHAQEMLEQQQEQYEADRKRQKIQAIADAISQAGTAFQNSRRPPPTVTNCHSAFGNTTCTTY